MDRREHHRAQLQLPVRLRWSTPLGQKTEVCETVDASRGGLLVPCHESHATGMTLWVTFPYDISLGDGQPEILAKVVRSAENSNGSRSTNGKKLGVAPPKSNGLHEAAVAVHFEISPGRASNGKGQPRQQERRASARRPLSMPVRVRPQNIPWFEEAMTVDVSTEGLRFVSNREYQVGEHLFTSFEPYAAAAPWPGAKEFRSRVVRVEGVPQSPTLAVSVCRSA